MVTSTRRVIIILQVDVMMLASWVMPQSIARMAPLWKWREDVQPRSGKDEALSEDMDHTSGSVGRKKFVPFNRLDIGTL